MTFAKEIQVGQRQIGEGHPAFIIAEAGVNHNGDMDRAREMIDVAADCKADAIKFQSFITKELILEHVDMAAYQEANLQNKSSQYEMLKKLEVPAQNMVELKAYADKKGITFLSTPFDEVSLHALDACALDAYKVASTDTTNIQFLRAMATKGKPMFLSTGMTYGPEIAYVLQALLPINQNIVLLQCTADYPTAPSEVNLQVIRQYALTYDILVGFSDHTQGLGASPYAIAYGAKVIEKHFTLDRSLPGPDHTASLEPQELEALIEAIRTAETYAGSPHKYPTIRELGTRTALQKCLVAKKPITKGETFQEDNLTAKRTGGKGLPAIYFDQMIGQQATRDYQTNDIIAS